MFLFTGALFLSGYVLQQQTVRDLRAAIKPEPTPPAARLYLPTQFAAQRIQSPKEELNRVLDGVSAETQDSRVSDAVATMEDSSNDKVDDGSGRMKDAVWDDTREGRGTQESGRLAQDYEGNTNILEGQEPMIVKGEQSPNQPDVLDHALSVPPLEDKPKEEKPLSRAERRKKIKEEILAAGEGEGFKGYKRRQW